MSKHSLTTYMGHLTPQSHQGPGRRKSVPWWVHTQGINHQEHAAADTGPAQAHSQGPASGVRSRTLM